MQDYINIEKRLNAREIYIESIENFKVVVGKKVDSIYKDIVKKVDIAKSAGQLSCWLEMEGKIDVYREAINVVINLLKEDEFLIENMTTYSSGHAMKLCWEHQKEVVERFSVDSEMYNDNKKEFEDMCK